jgi:hypothetical protein
MNMSLELSARRATVGEEVIVRLPEGQSVIGRVMAGLSANNIVNVSCDIGGAGGEKREVFGVPLFDPLSADDLKSLAAGGHKVVAEWPAVEAVKAGKRK